jgi:2-keto-4-pentenoate hydratase/2-oxohepta-3-ene-1,7-dioic acid hydratase in catechol pathway
MKIFRGLNQQQQIVYAAEKNGSLFAIQGDIFGNYEVTTTPVQLTKILAPLEPRAIFCIGLNYRKHAEETKAKIPQFPVLFMKSPGAVQHPNEPVYLPTKLKSHQVDFECELAVIIGKTCKNVSKENAYDYILGYTCGNDISARDWQKDFGGSQWCRGKTFDTFCPLGPCLVTRNAIANPHALAISTTLNGTKMQDWTTGDMIFDIPTLIEFLSGSTTLLPGTVILTGTPHGVGMARTPPVFLKDGDTLTVSIENIGELTNPVRNEP